MTRIRKRPSTASALVKPELHASNTTGVPHAPQRCLLAGPQFNPSFQDRRQSLLCPAGSAKEDVLLLTVAANSSHNGLSGGGEKKQLRAAPHYSKPYIVQVPSGVKRRGKEEGLGMGMSGGEGKLRDMEVPQHVAVKHMRSHGDGTSCTDLNRVGKEPAGLRGSAAYAGGGKRSDGTAGSSERAGKVGSAGSEQLTRVDFNGGLAADPTDADDGALEQPRKILPLQLILNSSGSPRPGSTTTTTAALKNLSNVQLPHDHTTALPSRSSPQAGAPNLQPEDVKRREVWAPSLAGPSAGPEKLIMKESPPLHKPQSTSLPLRADADHKKVSPPQPLMPLVQLTDSDQSPDVKTAAGVAGAGAGPGSGGGFTSEVGEARGNSDQSLDCWPVSSWQGHRRARSSLPSGRLPFEATGLAARGPSVNIDPHPQRSRHIIKAETKVKVYPQPEKSKKLFCMQTKELLTASHINELVTGVPQRNAIAGTSSSDASKKRKRTDDSHQNAHSSAREVASHAAPNAVILADSMRCRRKDGRRWRCKEQVVKPGAPFCHYHTLKMREKHMTSVARRLAKRQLQRERVARQEAVAAGSKGRPRKRERRQQDAGFGGAGRMRVMAAAREEGHDDDDDEDEDEDEEEEKVVDDNDDEEVELHEPEEESSEDVDVEADEQIKSSKQMQSAGSALKSRWRKKCKPCIRRLLDIQDRPRPVAGDGLDCTAVASSSSVCRVIHPPPCRPVNIDMSNRSTTSSSWTLIRPPASPLPECHLNTDPYEWRPDFP